MNNFLRGISTRILKAPVPPAMPPQLKMNGADDNGSMGSASTGFAGQADNVNDQQTKAKKGKFFLGGSNRNVEKKKATDDEDDSPAPPPKLLNLRRNMISTRITNLFIPIGHNPNKRQPASNQLSQAELGAISSSSVPKAVRQTSGVGHVNRPREKTPPKLRVASTASFGSNPSSANHIQTEASMSQVAPPITGRNSFHSHTSSTKAPPPIRVASNRSGSIHESNKSASNLHALQVDLSEDLTKHEEEPLRKKELLQQRKSVPKNDPFEQHEEELAFSLCSIGGILICCCLLLIGAGVFVGVSYSYDLFFFEEDSENQAFPFLANDDFVLSFKLSSEENATLIGDESDDSFQLYSEGEPLTILMACADQSPISCLTAVFGQSAQLAGKCPVCENQITLLQFGGDEEIASITGSVNGSSIVNFRIALDDSINATFGSEAEDTSDSDLISFESQVDVEVSQITGVFGFLDTEGSVQSIGFIGKEA